MQAEPATHWSHLYLNKRAAELSWYEPYPRRSLELIQETGVAADAPILDVGGGASLLVDELLKLGYSDVTVLDLAPEALAQSQSRLGPAAERVRWIEADVTRFRLPRRYAVWHDRAVLHFLIDAEEQEQYVRALRDALMPEGHLVLATFGPAGPTRCSGLPVQRYSPETLSTLLGPDFALRNSVLEDHRTPAGGVQQFLYTRWQAVA
jgi:SAM-dependent methyltransferase